MNSNTLVRGAGIVALVFAMGAGMGSLQASADLFQCPPTCDGTANNDIIQGDGNLAGVQQLNNNIDGGPGDDTLIGGEGNDQIEGGAGNDTLFGGPGNDDLTDAGGGDDKMFPGPDSDQGVAFVQSGGKGTAAAWSLNALGLGGQQSVDSGDGNDKITVTAGEIHGMGGPFKVQGSDNDKATMAVAQLHGMNLDVSAGGLNIICGPGTDTVNFVGFGPLTFDQTQTPFSFLVVDPTTGGVIYVDLTCERINGLTQFPQQPANN